MTTGLYQRFDTPGLAARDRFEYWRGWYSQAIDAPMWLEPLGTVPSAFDAAAEVLALGDVDIVEYRFGEAVGSWTRDGVAATDRVRLVMLAPAPAARGSWHGHELSLADGAAALLGRTDGHWRAPGGLRGIQVNVPAAAVAVSDAQLEQYNAHNRLRCDPIFARLIRPTLLGLTGHLDELATSEPSELRALWISLLTMLTRSLAGQDTNGTDTVQARLLQAGRYIHANLADPRLSPTTVADALHLSRSTLYAALPHDAQGIAAEIRRQRLERAHSILCDPANTLPIAGVATAVGIPNAAHFSRIFRDHYGLTPRELRAQHHTRSTPTSTDSRPGPQSVWGRVAPRRPPRKDSTNSGLAASSLGVPCIRSMPPPIT